MSVTVSSLVWRRSQARGNARLILLALADEADDRGMVTAYRRSRSHLAAKARCSESAVKRAVAELVTLGELVVLSTGSGREQTDYRIALADEGGHSDPPPTRPPRGAKSNPQGGQPEPPGGSVVTPPSSRSNPVLPGLIPDPPDPAPVDDAHQIARAVWEARNPRPAIPFPAVRTIARALLDAGHAADAITAAMVAVPTISTRWVEAELNRSRPRAVAAVADTRHLPSGRIDT